MTDDARLPVLRSIESRGRGDYWVVFDDPGCERAGRVTVTDDARSAWPLVCVEPDLYRAWPGDAPSLRSVVFAVSAFHRVGRTPPDTGERRCVRCARPVTVNAEHYETFERMHYVCFHYEFEHGDADMDADCGAGGCPAVAAYE